MKKVLIGLLLVLCVAGGFLYFWIFGPTKSASGPIAAEHLGTVENTFRIDQDRSEVRFIIHEELRGRPVDVVGSTHQVAGEAALDLDDLSSARFGKIQVNARTFATDEEMRNRMIRNRILSTDEYEFIDFQPTSVSGLPSRAAVGDTVPFQLNGDVTIRDITRPLSLDAELHVDSESELTISATAKLSRADFEIMIPQVPSVANVGDEIQLEIEAVAVPL